MCCLQFSDLFLASLPLHPQSFSRCDQQLFTNALPLISEPSLMLPPKKYSFQMWNEVRVHELQHCLCASHCGRNLGKLNVSETELPLPSLWAECAASDFVLSDYFLTNDLLLEIPSSSSICPYAGVIMRVRFTPQFQGRSQITLRFCWPVVFQPVPVWWHGRSEAYRYCSLG